jgi:hypothetical protein
MVKPILCRLCNFRTNYEMENITVCPHNYRTRHAVEYGQALNKIRSFVRILSCSKLDKVGGIIGGI